MGSLGVFFFLYCRHSPGSYTSTVCVCVCTQIWIHGDMQGHVSPCIVSGKRLLSAAWQCCVIVALLLQMFGPAILAVFIQV